MEKFQIMGILAIVFIGAGAYMAYVPGSFMPIATQSSSLNTLSKPTQVVLSATSMTSSVGKGTLTITPYNGYLMNETLSVVIKPTSLGASAATANISVYSTLPLTLVKGGTDGNATYMLPITNQPLSITFINSFSNTTATYSITYSVSGPLSNSTEVTG
ncbi:MAG: hypothetical protein JRN26_00890 [Nitrososphaerota archaeon]|jgi:hypothetical protein|nr:hypothetical protein [Nitrososphaerota archaeon]MDG6935435.1 hypothetical protein [Nitrososphaerota archaeon]MDG6944325.1 hypothetical protein [Nitrososphaerota archaeon]